MTSSTVKLAHGPLAGAFVQVSTSPPTAGYLAGYYHGLIVQVIAPSADEAIGVTESLAAVR
jgi:MFS superfamily sulfate permease-like transporter